MMVKNILPAGASRARHHRFRVRTVASLLKCSSIAAPHSSPEDFYKPMKKGNGARHNYVMVGRGCHLVVVVLLGLAWMPVMMGMETSVLPAGHTVAHRSGNGGCLHARHLLKRITPKAGEWGLIGGFLIGMLRLVTNVVTEESGKGGYERRVLGQYGMVLADQLAHLRVAGCSCSSS